MSRHLAVVAKTPHNFKCLERGSMSTPVPPPQYDDMAAYHGHSVKVDLRDIAARRHLVPSVMDDPISTERQCICPGGPDFENFCIDIWTNYEDRLCNMCRLYCYETDHMNVQHRYIDIYGTVLPAIPSQLVWGPNEKKTRSHAFIMECRGCHNSLSEHAADPATAPGSLCRQAWARNWSDLGTDVESLPRCVTCQQLAEAREQANEKRIVRG